MSSKDDLVNAINLIKNGETGPAGEILHDLLFAEPENERAWLAMSYCVTTPEDKRFCLERVLAIDPANAAASKFLARLDQNASTAVSNMVQSNQNQSMTAPTSTGSMRNLYIAVGISLLIVVLIVILLALTSH